MPVNLFCLIYILDDFTRFRTATDFHSRIPISLEHSRQETSGNTFMHQEALHRIADPGPGNLGVKTDISSHLRIRKFIHKYMGDAFIMLDHRDFLMFLDKTD